MRSTRSTMGAAVLSLAAALPGIGHAQEGYPNKPITVIVPFAPGGNLDVTARIVLAQMSQLLGQPITVDNRAGAGGVIGHQAVARAIPDGYTLAATANGSFTITPRLRAGARPFEPGEFAPIGMIGVTPLVLEVKAPGKFKDFKEFVAYAKANPGKISMGSAGNGTTNHLAILQLEEAAGIKLNIVPYKGSNPALSDLLGGQIDAMIDQLPSSLNYLRGAKLVALAVTTPKRSSDLPDVPTFAESGISNFDVSTAAGLLAPAKTPSPIIDKLNKALNQALTNKDVEARLLGLGSQPTPMSPVQFRDFLMGEDAKAQALYLRGVLSAE